MFISGFNTLDNAELKILYTTTYGFSHIKGRVFIASVFVCEPRLSFNQWAEMSSYLFIKGPYRLYFSDVNTTKGTTTHHTADKFKTVEQII